MYNKTIKLIALAALCSNAFAAKFSGQLVNHQNQPLTDTLVKVRGSDLSQTTDANGKFIFDLPPGQYTLDIKAGQQGHFHQSISVDENSEVKVIHVDVQHERKVVITANPLEHTKLDMAAPAIVMSGDELIKKRAASIGDMLQLEPGMSVSSFGPSVSRPIIRGLSGGRVLMTTNQMSVQDASTTSADHDVSLEPLLANQIEVLKGPATLLYGSGAIGGVVNVTDNRINPEGALETNGGIEARFGDSATGEESIVATITGGTESFAWHFDAFSSKFNDIEIPGEAESEALHEAEGHEEHEEHEGEEHEEESRGVLENSRSESDGASIGLTWNGTWGYFGLSVNQIDKLYGVPGHAHGEEHAEGGEAHEEEHEGEEHEEGVFIDLEQTRWDIQGQINQPFSNIDEWFIGWSYTDYQHVELEGEEIGTMFDNEAMELRSYMKHSPLNNWEGIWGLQYSDRDFSAIGDEAFVPPSQTQSGAIFLVEEKRFGDWKLELGARLESQSVKIDGESEKDFATTSLSIGSVYNFSKNRKFAINLSQAERAPTAEELFSFGEHAATQTFELGNANLDKEVSYNLDISWRFSSESMSSEINVYWNQFHDFIYGEFLANNGFITDRNGQVVAIEEDLPIIRQTQDSASFRGLEIQINANIMESNGFGLDLGLMADYLEAELDNGEYIPRIPPLKYGFSLQFTQDNFNADLNWTRFEDQEHIAQGELPTEGFDMLDLDVSYRLFSQNHEALFFFRAKNLLDEEARDHSSFLKDLAPRAGRNFLAGIRYQF
ncbi:TonB-dependent receptor domain-containing protein [Pleionea sediminis]|uniref:TonB-dependent receptor domain-containing protein n=1 Tax=Pleionea sediminis TaxID=2569479 RepID=UPI00118596D6|nr:TonB-dependent receptor [Pleionea sediminis]